MDRQAYIDGQLRGRDGRFIKSADECSIEDCSEPHYARGWCNKHYRRFRRYGDPNAVQQIHGDDEARFWSYVDKRPDGCWIWTGTTGTGGYGQFCVDGKTRLAHRWSYEFLVGPITDRTLDHLCRNPSCINPDHLEPVSYRTNTLRGTSLVAENAAKTHCSSGHPFNEDNTYIFRGGRYCKECRRRASREYQRRRRAAKKEVS